MKTFNLEGAAAYLNVSPDTMRDLAADGDVAGAKIGKAWVLTEAHLDEFLLKEIKKQTAARRNDPADKPALADVPNSPPCNPSLLRWRMRGFPLREINDGGFQGDSFR